MKLKNGKKVGTLCLQQFKYFSTVIEHVNCGIYSRLYNIQVLNLS